MTHRFDPQAELRVAVAGIELELVALTKLANSLEHQAAARKLTALFGGLVKLLALGTAPAVRECPNCGHLGMAAATLCGYCWARLVPSPVGGRATGPAAAPGVVAQPISALRSVDDSGQ